MDCDRQPRSVHSLSTCELLFKRKGQSTRLLVRRDTVNTPDHAFHTPGASHGQTPRLLSCEAETSPRIISISLYIDPTAAATRKGENIGVDRYLESR